MPTITPQLETIAKRLIWWIPPGQSLADQDNFLCRVMTFGLWDDAVHVIKVYGEDALRQAIRHAPAGAFDEPSWNYWHGRLGIRELPARPPSNFFLKSLLPRDSQLDHEPTAQRIRQVSGIDLES